MWSNIIAENISRDYPLSFFCLITKYSKYFGHSHYLKVTVLQMEFNLLSIAKVTGEKLNTDKAFVKNSFSYL